METVKGTVFKSQYKENDVITEAQRKVIADAIIVKLVRNPDIEFDKHLYSHIKNEIGIRFPQEKEVILTIYNH